MSWKFSCADFTFPLLAHEKALSLIRLLDVHAVDLGIFAGRSHWEPKDIVPNVEATARRMKQSLAASEIEPADVFLQTGPEPSIHATNSPDPSIRAANRDTFKAILDFTTRIGCTHMTGLPGVTHSGVDPKADLEHAAVETAWRVETARASGVIYSIEPHLGSIIAEPERVTAFLRKVPGLTLTLDYGHFAFQNIPIDRVHPLLAHASHIHIRGGAADRLQTNMSKNTIDFADIALRLREMNYCGHVCLEYVWIDWMECNTSDNVSETILLKQLFERV